ncbi:hypothetical protein BDR26DRAFT_858416 [Obelidium mucronatum]|nr:hypothetical protein BDR26DRAFT_858416 [Obelidium mucronatum]
MMATGTKRKMDDCWDEWWQEEDGDEDRAERFEKYFKAEETTEPADPAERQFTCSIAISCAELPPFTSRTAYKEHCRLEHSNPCSFCKRILPSKKMLDLHIMEIHDSFFQVLAERGNSYECFVDNCTRKCSGPFKRKLHLMDKHKFPASFNFHVILGKGRGKDGKVNVVKAASPKRSPQFPPRVVAPKKTNGESLDKESNLPPPSDCSSSSTTTLATTAAESGSKKRSGKPRSKNKKASTTKDDSLDSNMIEPDDDDTPMDQNSNISDNPPSLDDDPFQSLVDSVKKLSLVPRSVSHKPKQQQQPMSLISSAAATAMQIERPLTMTVEPLVPIPTITKTNSWSTSVSSITSVPSPADAYCSSSRSQASSAALAPKYQGHTANQGGMWTREKVLAAYLSRIPQRGKEAERLWKEKRSARVVASGVVGVVVVGSAEISTSRMEEDDEEDGTGDGFDFIDFDS